MADINAVKVSGGLGNHNVIPYWGKTLDGFDADTHLDFQINISSDALPSLHSTATRIEALAHVRALSAYKTTHYADDYYERIHIKPNYINIGNLLTEQVRNFTVWNAFYAPKTLQTVEQLNDEGLQLTQPEPPPTSFASLEERTYTVNVTLTGAPVIDAQYRFQFLGLDYVGAVRIVGNRVVVFPFLPHLESTERLKWLTDIIKTRQGEQRIAMRVAPRQEFDYRYTLDELEFSTLKIIAGGWSFRVWALPVWIEAEYDKSITEGAEQILTDTTTADYRAGDVALIYSDYQTFEVVEIDQVLADRITLVRPVLASYQGAAVMPIRFARTPEGVSILRTGAGLQEVSARFAVDDNIDLSAQAPSYPTYKGQPVVTDRSFVLSRSLNERIHRPIIEVDNGQGAVIVETQQDYTDFAQTINYLAEDKSELWDLRTWLHSRYGRQKAFYIPSFNRDIQPLEPTTELQTSVQIEPILLDLYGELPKSIMIFFKDGSTLFREIIGTQTVNGIASITIDSAIGERALEDFDMISFLSLVRLNADTITIRHDKYSQLSVPVMEVPQ
jgi:hypothetical protein